MALKRIELVEVDAVLRVFEDPSGAFDKSLGTGFVKYGAAEDPGTFGERMKRLDLGVFGGKAQGLGASIIPGYAPPLVRSASAQPTRPLAPTIEVLRSGK